MKSKQTIHQKVMLELSIRFYILYDDLFNLIKLNLENVATIQLELIGLT